MTIQERYEGVLAYFQEAKPYADTELEYKDPYQLIVAVILSAQCTDKRVNMITPALFNEYPTVFDMALAEPEDILPYIKSCSYPNNKSKNLSGMARMLAGEFKGKVPEDPDMLEKLPGVGRKTANVIASVVYKLPRIAVDTHVFRVAARIGLTHNAKTPLQTEMQLVKNIPESQRRIAHHWLILHGRYTCKARKPDCFRCGITKYCKYFNSKKRKVVNYLKP